MESSKLVFKLSIIILSFLGGEGLDILGGNTNNPFCLE